MIASPMSLGQDYGWKNLLEDAMTGALSAVPILSLTIKTKRDMKIVGIALTIVKAGWFYKTGKEKGYSSKKAALYSGTSLLLETPDFSGMETSKVTRELKQLGLNVTYEVGFSFMRTGVNAAFDVSDTSRTARKTGAYSSSKYMPSINKETGFIRPIENPIEYVVNRSHL